MTLCTDNRHREQDRDAAARARFRVGDAPHGTARPEDGNVPSPDTSSSGSVWNVKGVDGGSEIPPFVMTALFCDQDHGEVLLGLIKLPYMGSGHCALCGRRFVHAHPLLVSGLTG